MRVLNAASVVLKGLRNDSKGMVLSPVVPMLKSIKHDMKPLAFKSFNGGGSGGRNTSQSSISMKEVQHWGFCGQVAL